MHIGSLLGALAAGPPCADPEGGQGSGPLLKNHKNIGFLSNTGPEPLKNHKATKPAFYVEPSFARHRNGVLLPNCY